MVSTFNSWKNSEKLPLQKEGGPEQLTPPRAAEYTGISRKSSGKMTRKGEPVMEETMLNPLYDEDGCLLQAVCYDDDDEMGDLEEEE
jgi:hypothetical protein